MMDLHRETPGSGFKKQVFLLNNFIWANRKGETKLYFLPIGRNKIIGNTRENKNILDEILVSLFSCFSNPFPEYK